MTDVVDLDRRVSTLEAAQNDTTQTMRWVVAKLGQVTAVQEQHSLRLERIEGDVREVKADIREVKADLREVKADLRALRDELPGMIADTMREVLREGR